MYFGAVRAMRAVRYFVTPTVAVFTAALDLALSNMSSMRIDWLSNFNVNIFNNYYMACKQDFKVFAESVLAKVLSRLDKSLALFTRILGSAERNGYVA